MYQVPSTYNRYYKDYIDRDVRQFALECSIGSGSNVTSIPENKISSVLIDYDLLSGSEEYTIGNLASGKLTMIVSSDVLVFETNTITLTIKLKAQDVYGTEIWIPVPLGRFHVFEVSSTQLSKTISAYDDLYKKELETEYASALIYPTTTHAVLSELCGILDISYASNIPDKIINRPPLVNEVIKREDGKFEIIESDSDQVCLGMTIGQALGYIASYLGGNFIVDGDCRLKLIKYPTQVTKSYDYTKFGEQVIGEASYNISGLNCLIYEGNTISVGSEDAEKSIAFDNPFMNRTKLLEILADIENINYNTSKVRLKGDPTLQLGDLIETYELNDLGYAINKRETPILRMVFSYTGGCSNTIEAPCRTAVEKTINYKGTVTSRLDVLENTVTATNSEIDKINSALSSLRTVKDNMDDMNVFVTTSPTEVSVSKFNQYNLLLQQLLASDADFESKYLVVYNNRYL
jgi:hypothetical protein